MSDTTHLERRLNRLRVWNIALGVTLFATFTLGAISRPPVEKEIKAESFVLVDESGQSLGGLVNADGVPAFMVASQGLTTMITPFGLSCMDKSMNTRLTAGRIMGRAAYGVQAFAEDNSISVSLTANDNESGGLVMFSGDEIPIASMGFVTNTSLKSSDNEILKLATPNQGYVLLGNGSGQLVWSAP